MRAGAQPRRGLLSAEVAAHVIDATSLRVPAVESIMIHKIYRNIFKIGFASRASVADALTLAFFDRPIDRRTELPDFLGQATPDFISVLRNEPEHRLLMPDFYGPTTPAQPPNKILLDHVPKTGGLLIFSILNYLYPLHVVAPHRDVWVEGPEATGTYSANWPVIAGHIGRPHHRLIPDHQNRLRCTVVRDPVGWIRSIYSYWRHVIISDSPDFDRPLVAKARRLSFSEFIRAPECAELINFQTTFLSPAGSGSIDAIFDYYDIVGVNPDIPGFLRLLFEQAGIESPVPIEKLIAITPPNASPPTGISDEDRAFIVTQWSSDHRLYERAKERWTARASAA